MASIMKRRNAGVIPAPLSLVLWDLPACLLGDLISFSIGLKALAVLPYTYVFLPAATKTPSFRVYYILCTISKFFQNIPFSGFFKYPKLCALRSRIVVKFLLCRCNGLSGNDLSF